MKKCPTLFVEFVICIENISVRPRFAQLQIVWKVGQLGRYADGRPMQQTFAIYADMLLAQARGVGEVRLDHRLCLLHPIKTLLLS